MNKHDEEKLVEERKMEEKTRKRKKKKDKPMPVEGKGVFEVKRIKEESEE